jgi:hypothetical protein
MEFAERCARLKASVKRMKPKKFSDVIKALEKKSIEDEADLQKLLDSGGYSKALPIRKANVEKNKV